MNLFKELVRSKLAMLDSTQLLREVQEVMHSMAEVESILELPHRSTLTINNLLLERDQFMAGKEMSLTLQAIPEIDVSELGWTDVRTGGGDGKPIDGPARTQLKQFLSQVAEGGDFAAKISSLSEFYSNPETFLGRLDSLPQGQRIARILSYLVFFKALTKVVSNFNAASAGFNFEAFLSVLTNGTQIQANTGTIADFVSRLEGKAIPISLKLYAEKSAAAGGSFTDLAGDLINPKFKGFEGMRYYVCMKSFTAKDEKGKVMTQGLGVEGDIKFFEFDFTLDNIVNIIAASMPKSIKCIQIIRGFKETGQDAAAQLPGSNMPTPEEMESQFVDYFVAGAKESQYPDYDFQPFLDALEWANNEELFQAAGRGKAPMYVTKIKGVLRDPGTVENPLPHIPQEIKDQGTKEVSAFVKELLRICRDANQGVVELYQAKILQDERKAIVSEPGFYLDIPESVEFYNSLKTPQLKKAALEQMRGVVETHQFDVNRAQIVELSRDLGSLKIGTSVVQGMLNRMTEELNGAIFDIFTNVKTVQESTYGFIAGGLQDSNLAQNGINASESIITKTRELKSTKSE